MGKQLEKEQLWLPPAPPCGGHPIKGGGKIACRLELKTWVFVKSSASIQVQLQELVKGVARQHGFSATFMAKPFGDQPGNGMHVHFSLLDETGKT